MKEKKLILKAIVVVDKNWAIGCNGQLLIHVPEDLKHFKERTWRSIVVYGKNTLASFPKSKPLPGRPNWIISSSLAFNPASLCLEGDNRVFASVADLFAALSLLPEDEVVWLIGGAQLYRTLLPYCSEVVVTELDYTSTKADVFFPNLAQMEAWILSEEGKWQESEKAGISFKINVYTQKDVVMLTNEN